MMEKLTGTAALERLSRQFIERYGDSDNPPAAFYAPGRVNLIGEHTDYTGGLVFPCAINSGTLLMMRRNDEHRYRFASNNTDSSATLGPGELRTPLDDSWINYPLGVIDQFLQRGIKLDGVDCLFEGDVPSGAGLSSSASIEVVTAFALTRLFSAGLNHLDLVMLSQAAENGFVGTQSGILDQFAVTMAEADHAMMLDCHSLEYRQVPLMLGKHRNDGQNSDQRIGQAWQANLTILLGNTNQRRELHESAYNARVAECARALTLMQSVLPVQRLAEVTPAQLEQHAGVFDGDPVALQRARHIASENARVRDAVPALEAGDMQRFGKLMSASHISLRDDFDVSSAALDHLVRLALDVEGVLGSRMTGGGFGGCTVTLLPSAIVAAYQTQVGAQYTAATGLTADFYSIVPSGGVRQPVLPPSQLTS